MSLVFILDWRVVSNQGSSQRLLIAPQTILASMTIGFFHPGTAWWSRHTEWRWKSRVGTDRVGRDFGETVVTASRERRERETIVKSFQGARLDLCTRNHWRRLLKCSKGQKTNEVFALRYWQIKPAWRKSKGQAVQRYLQQHQYFLQCMDIFSFKVHI